MKPANAGEIFLTVLLFGWISITLLAGFQLIGLLTLPHRALVYIGAALIGYILLAGICVSYMCVKFMLTKKG